MFGELNEIVFWLATYSFIQHLIWSLFLVTCREVNKWWQKFIDEQKTIPLRKLQARNQLQSLVKFAKCFEKIRSFPFSIVHWWNKEFHRVNIRVKSFHGHYLGYIFWKISIYVHRYQFSFKFPALFHVNNQNSCNYSECCLSQRKRKSVSTIIKPRLWLIPL